jgi:tetratricopeptide (TPR) repeat protein
VDEATSAEDLNELGVELVDRYEQEGDLALLRRAQEAHEQALRDALTAADRAAYLNNVGNCLRLEYCETGDPADLEMARQRFESAVATVPPGSADRPMYLDNLALALRDRYADTGSQADLDRAVELHEEAVATAPDEAAEKLLYLNNLGGAYWERYQITGTTSDLGRAVTMLECAVEGTIPAAKKGASQGERGTPGHPARQPGLGRTPALK